MINNFKDEFNKNMRDMYWNNPAMRSEIIDNFRSACRQYKEAKTCPNQLSGWKKNQMGGRGVGARGLNSGLCSENAQNIHFLFFVQTCSENAIILILRTLVVENP